MYLLAGVRLRPSRVVAKVYFSIFQHPARFGPEADKDVARLLSS
jgi:hypothetical protein